MAQITRRRLFGLVGTLVTAAAVCPAVTAAAVPAVWVEGAHLTVRPTLNGWPEIDRQKAEAVCDAWYVLATIEVIAVLAVVLFVLGGRG
jgi:hypothetical protein